MAGVHRSGAHRRLAHIPLLVFAVLLLPLGPLLAQTAAPQLWLEPGSALPGTVVTASGSGFPADSDGQLLWTDGSPLGAFSTDDAGAFSLDFTVPEVAPGDYSLTAVVADEDDEVSVDAAFTVDAPPAPTPPPAPTAAPTDVPPPTAVPTDVPVPTDAVAAPTEVPYYPIVSSVDDANRPAAALAHDGDPATAWLTDPVAPEEAFLTLDLGEVRAIGSIRFLLATAGTLGDVELQLSEDGVTWGSLVTLDGPSLPTGVWQEQPVDVWARYVRLVLPNPAGLAQLGGFAEIELWPAAEARPLSAIITPEPLPTEVTATEVTATEAGEAPPPDAAVPTEPAPALPDVTGQGTIGNTGGVGAYCYVAPDASAEVIGVIPDGATVDLAGEPAGGFQPVMCDGQAAYIGASFVIQSEETEAPATAPETTAEAVEPTPELVITAAESTPSPVTTPTPAATPIAPTPTTAATPIAPTPTTAATPIAPTPTTAAGPLPGESLTLPIRAAFYYPWFPGAWTQQGEYPFTNYTPSRGFYDGGDPAVIAGHIADMQYGNIEAGIASWWGQGTREDQRMPQLLAGAAGTGFRWAVYYEDEGFGNPSVATIRADLEYLRDRYAADPSYLRIDGRFVVFVFGGAESCGMVDRWTQANTVDAYIVLKVFPGYENCPNQPDSWHQYAPAVAADAQPPYSYSISPGFHLYGQSERLARDLARWQQSVQAMVASGADWQLVTTFNEWGEGTSVESAEEWASESGFGHYLDVLHANGQGTAPPPEPTATTQAPTPTATTAAPTPTPPPPTATTAPTPTQPAPTATTAAPTPTPTQPPSGGSAVLLAAGDISTCSNNGDEQTAQILDGQAGTVATLGDNAYEDGTSSQFANCYDPTWGRHKDRTRPSPGNHDYHTGGASGYYNYFGAAAGPAGRGYYSYDLGAWHIISLNSNISMGPGSAQEQWLRSDLAANTDNCTLAYWHHPRFSSSSTHGNTPGTAPLYQALYDHGAELVLVGHDHTYERFAPQAPNAQADPAFGIREFVVGTGGRSHYGFDSPEPNSEIRNGTTFGVLKLTLNPSGYSWQFLPVAGGSFSDSGSGTCHDTPGGAAADNTIAQATLVMALPTQAAMLTRIPARIVRGKTRNRSFDRGERIDQPFSRWAQRRAWMPGRARRH